jgi:hypothetical protein
MPYIQNVSKLTGGEHATIAQSAIPGVQLSQYLYKKTSSHSYKEGNIRSGLSSENTWNCTDQTQITIINYFKQN